MDGNANIGIVALRAMFVSLTCTYVTTYINSGNVIFSDDRSQLALAPLI